MMKKQNKVVIIGAASITWMPTFLSDLARTASMSGGTIVLHDIDKEKQEIIYKFALKLFKAKNVDMTLVVEPDIDRALIDADFVVNTVLIGGHDIWTQDMNIILKYGIEHPKGMSVGPGGFGMGIKQIPFIVDLAKRMERICPAAWLLNFSNPMQALTKAVLDNSSIKCIGLCHGVTGTIERIAELTGVSEQDLFYKIGGVNHFEIITELRQGDVNLLPLVADALEKEQREKGGSGEIITVENYRLFGSLQCNEDIHGIEFWPHYIRKGSRLEDYEQKHNFIENRVRDRDEMWHKLDDYLNDRLPVLEIVDDYSTEKLELIIDGVTSNTPTYLYANVLNGSSIPNLDEDICIEIPIVLFRDGFIPCAVGNMPQGFAQITNLHGSVQRYTVDAALNGSREDALRALTMDPMCYSLTKEERERLIIELIESGKEYLPLFFD